MKVPNCFDDEENYDDLIPGLGLLHADGEVLELTVDGRYSHLTEFNDDIESVGFDEIQNILMSHPENIFEPKVAEGIRAHFGEIDND